MYLLDALIIGAGPAGSTLANILAGEGQKVVVLEKEQFPRFHVGESLLPASNKIWDRLGVRSELDKNALKKPGGRWYYGENALQSHFCKAEERASFKQDAQAYSVERKKIDNILIEKAKEKGASVHFGYRVTDLLFEGNQCVGVKARSDNGNEEKFLARCVFDCSGLGALLSNKLKIRRPNALNRMAVFAHYETEAKEERLKEGWFVGAMINNGWVWTIPISNEVISIGVVDTIENYKKAKLNPEAYLEDKIATVPYFRNAIGSTWKRVSDVHCMGNLGYTSDYFAGDGWVLVGDAAFFIDPCYSSGVHLALTSAAIAADSFLSIDSNRPMLKKDFQKYEKKMRKDEKNVTKLVKAFYQASVNKKFREWVPASDNAFLNQKFATITGGDFEKNGFFINLLYYTGKAFQLIFPDRNEFKSKA